jgi:hypothetical protein
VSASNEQNRLHPLPPVAEQGAKTRTDYPELRIEPRERPRSRLVLGVFGDLKRAGSAMLALEERGFAPDDITLRLSKENRDVIEGRRIFRDQGGRTYIARTPIALRKQRLWQSGLGSGAAIGAGAGALAAVVAGSAGTPALLVFGAPFLSSFVVAWALVGIGATVGGVIGAIVGLAREEFRAADYEGCRILEGAIVGVAVNDEAEADAVERDLASQGADVVSTA